MKHFIVTVAAVLGLVLGPHASARGDDWRPDRQAQDHRPCVSLREYDNMNFTWKRHRLHRHFETRGTLVAPGLWPGYDYKACGYSMSEAWVTIYYDVRSKLPVLAERWWYVNATLNGHARGWLRLDGLRSTEPVWVPSGAALCCRSPAPLSGRIRCGQTPRCVTLCYA